ncbi:MAG: hypothetical protein GEU96_14505 [Propionibacteriales bacterium]|nr:hypothetical protein [Propionibacteriales bacterium]
MRSTSTRPRWASSCSAAPPCWFSSPVSSWSARAPAAGCTGAASSRRPAGWSRSRSFATPRAATLGTRMLATGTLGTATPGTATLGTGMRSTTTRSSDETALRRPAERSVRSGGISRRLSQPSSSSSDRTNGCDSSRP